jgi:signal transduction histidine kinase
MQHHPIGDLMIRANFGRTGLGGATLLIANYYRLMLAALVVALIVCHLPLVGAPMLLALMLGAYVCYVAFRFRVFSLRESWFYTPRVQFWRAQLAIIGVTLFLGLLQIWGPTGSLWVLYLPALLMVSRYCTRRRAYTGVAIEAALAAAALRLAEIGPTTLPTLILLGELGGRFVAVLLPSFLVHYLARVDVTAKRGAEVRDQIIQMLLERVLLDTNGDTLWWAIREACLRAVGAHDSVLYLYDHERGHLRELACAAARCVLGHRIDAATTGHIAADAIRQGGAVERPTSDGLVELAAPIYGQPAQGGRPLAVIVVRCRARTAYERRAIRQFLTDLLHHIWPLCAYASMRQQYPLQVTVDDGGVHSLQLDDVIDSALETLCRVLGFSLATISIVDEDQQEIRTVRGKNVPEGWVSVARHRLDSRDIQADVLRSGKVEIIKGWDPRFDQEIWTTYHHADLIRVWVPLGRFGTIEAGFYLHERDDIPPLLIEMVQRYARDLTIAIKNAQLYEREQRYAAVLARLHEVSYDLQTDARQRDEGELLKQIAQAAHAGLQADIVMLYPLQRRDERFGRPVHVGNIDGPQPLQPADDGDNVVHHIAATRAPYYQPDVQQDPRLVGSALEPYHSKRHRTPPNRTFAVRQNVCSFAGVPLLARGELLGVLCVNFRERNQFSPHDRQAIALFAQMAAAVIAGGQLAREQERKRLEYDLHDAVKSSLRGLILLSKAATEALPDDPCRAHAKLHEVRRAAWGILSDINIVLRNLSPGGYNSRVLHDVIRDDLRRVIGQDWSRLRLELDVKVPALPMGQTRALLFILREAVINALEHANPQLVCVHVQYRDPCLWLIVDDDGCGFDVDAAPDEEHRGLRSMRERVTAMGGDLQVFSCPDGGTRIWVEVPTKEACDGAD